MEQILNRLKQKIEVGSIIEQRADLYFITVQEEQIELVLSYLKQQENFTHLAFLQAVDLIEDNKFTFFQPCAWHMDYIIRFIPWLKPFTAVCDYVHNHPSATLSKIITVMMLHSSFDLFVTYWWFDAS